MIIIIIAHKLMNNDDSKVFHFKILTTPFLYIQNAYLCAIISVYILKNKYDKKDLTTNFDEATKKQ